MSRRQQSISVPKVYTGPEPNLPQTQTVMNDFSGGLKTEFHGLNFPPNAVTSEQNCRFTLTKEVTRRGGIDYEPNNSLLPAADSSSVNTYKWNNVGGDGQTQIIVTQIGVTLRFYLSSSATTSSSISSNYIGTFALTPFLVAGSSNDPSTVECNFADGNGYLFVFNQYCEPFYCTYNSGSNTVTANVIPIQIRDFTGLPEPGVAVSTRPTSLTNEHNYNLQNQGWTNNPSWTAGASNNWTIGTGSEAFTVASGITGISGGQSVTGKAFIPSLGVNSSFSGTVTSYAGTTLTINVTTVDQYNGYIVSGNITISSINTSLISTWNTGASSIGGYPSNADVWWTFKNSSGIFQPSVTAASITSPGASSGPAPKGSYILSAFNQNRSVVSGISSLTTIYTYNRPSTGTWFQGRVWFTGVNANFQATGDAPYTTWTENIYFSQTITSNTQFGLCYQQNDPTNEQYFDLLPTDGGVITIQGSGSIYELFPIQNGLVVRAANGIWFITGSQGIGFSATDYTITKISGVESVSQRPSVNVLGYPVFWNQEGIWTVMPSAQGGGLIVDNICLDTILTFYNSIPFASKRYARGDYNPLTYEIQWCYKSTVETGLSDRYHFDTILCFNTHTKAFYHFILTVNVNLIPYILDVKFVQGPGGANTPLPVFKYYCHAIISSYANYTFAQEYPTVYNDWTIQGNPTKYVSSFTTAYYLHGGGMKKFQPNCLYMYSRNAANASYIVQGTWDFAISGNSGRISMRQNVNNTASTTNYSMLYRRHRLRGRGTTMQIQVTSIDGLPFDFMGWAMWEVMNANP